MKKDPIAIKWTQFDNKITISANGSILVFGEREIMIVSLKQQVILQLFSNVKLESRSKSHIIFEKEDPDLMWPQLLDHETIPENVLVSWDS